MDRERLYRTEAVVLKRSDFGEADRLLTLYTPRLGKCRVLAKGVRRLTSRKAGHLELFTHAQLLVAKARSLDIVTQAETIDAYANLRKDLLRASRAYYAVELLDRFTGEGIENRPLFELLLRTLSWLNAEPDVDLVTRYYELHLLEMVGYRPQLFHCIGCQADIEPVTNCFSAAEGGVMCPHCGESSSGPALRTIPVNVLKVLRYLQTRPFESCRRLQLGAAIHRDLEHIMLCYVTYHLERNLKSIEFLRLLREPAHAPVAGLSTLTPSREDTPLT